MSIALADTPCNAYTSSILRPQLQGLGLNDNQQALVIADVSRRLNSLFAHWNDTAFRRTALLMGVEEATFYQPQGIHLELRALVVVGVRNSLIEDLGTPSPATTELRLRHPVLRDADVPAITRAAIEHFARYDDFQLSSELVLQDGEDMFGDLAVRYPSAWRALSHLANSILTEVSYDLSASSPRAPVWPTSAGTAAPETTVKVVTSGIDPGFDPQLIDCLNALESREIEIFFADSFKGVSRNPEKTFSIIEYLITDNLVFLTHNYIMTSTYASRRSPLLRPFHFSGEVITKLDNQLGVNMLHKSYLDTIRAQVG